MRTDNCDGETLWSPSVCGSRRGTIVAVASKRPGTTPTPQVVRDRVRSLPGRFRKESVNGLAAEWELHIGPQAFAVAIADHHCVVREGPGEAPHTTIRMDPSTWLSIDEGVIAGSQAFTDRKVTVTGNLDLAVRLQTLFRPYSRPWAAADLDQLRICRVTVNRRSRESTIRHGSTPASFGTCWTRWASRRPCSWGTPWVDGSRSSSDSVLPPE
jgi:putative sterol carrier protein